MDGQGLLIRRCHGGVGGGGGEQRVHRILWLKSESVAYAFDVVYG
jgi:hypothetical protein